MAGTTAARWRTSIGAVALGAVALAALPGCQTPNAVLRQRGLVALQQGDQATACDHFAVAVRQDPTDWKAQYNLGKLLLARGRALDGQLALDKARSLRPDHPETAQIIDSLAEALFQQGRRDSLRALLDEAVKTFGTSDDFLRQGEYLTRIGEVDGAKRAYLKAARFADADDPEPYTRLAGFYEHIGDHTKAVGAWQRAYFLAPDNAEVAAKLRQYGIVPGPTVGAPPR